MSVRAIRSKLVDDPTPPTLRDWTHSEAVAWFDERQDTHARPMGGKPPKGFWFQVGNDWERWCEGNMDGWLLGHRMILAVDRSDFAVLDSPEKISEFFNIYKDESSVFGVLMRGLDWSRVMEDFAGVELPNYCHGWSFSNSDGCGWTYGWDCASGVCWRPTTCIEILRIENREDYPAPEPNETIQ